MEIKLKDLTYGIAVSMVISVGVLNPDYSSENPPEKKLYDNTIKVSNIISSPSALVQ